MDTKRFGLAALAGFVSLFLVGYVLWGLLFFDFFATNVGSATGIAKDPPAFLWLAIGQIAFAVLLTMVLGWAGATTAVAGFKTGAIFGLLSGLGVDLVIYATTNMYNLTAALVDPVLVAIQVAIAGAVIAAVLGRAKPAAASP